MSKSLYTIIDEMNQIGPLFKKVLSSKIKDVQLIDILTQMEKDLTSCQLNNESDKMLADMCHFSIEKMKDILNRPSHNWKGAILLSIIVGTTFSMGYLSGYIMSTYV